MVLTRDRLRALSLRRSREDPHEIDVNNAALQEEYQRTLVERVSARVRPGDIVCHVFGPNMEVHGRLPACHHVETSVGYTASPSLPFRIYESSAWMHWHHGKAGREDGSHYQWVIPSGFDPNDWPCREQPGDYALFLGRLTLRKGMNELLEIARRLPDLPIRAYGPGDSSQWSASAPPNLQFFGPVFSALSPAEQAATRIGMRADLDSALRQRVGDVEALHGKLMGADGLNADKFGTAFGEEAPNKLQAAVGRERTFADTLSKATEGSKSSPSALSSMRLKAMGPGSRDVSGVMSFEAGLQAAKSAVYNPIVRALLTGDSGPMETEIARALVVQGATRDQVLGALSRVEARRAVVSGLASRLGTAARSAIAGTAPAARPLLDPAPVENRLMGAARGGMALVGGR